MIREHTPAFLWGEEGKGRGGYRISFIASQITEIMFVIKLLLDQLGF